MRIKKNDEKFIYRPPLDKEPLEEVKDYDPEDYKFIERDRDKNPIILNSGWAENLKIKSDNSNS